MDDRRILERTALVSALMLVLRSVAAAEDRLHGELLEDVLLGLDGSGRLTCARRAGIDLSVPHAVAEIAGERGLAADIGASCPPTRYALGPSSTTTSGAGPSWSRRCARTSPRAQPWPAPPRRCTCTRTRPPSAWTA